ncbi:MAG: hypothetical protein NT001_04510 [Candidatus Woesearchaeota archaeon]|nr:hypothetical protein [Candidatus Woesearchaeota archaeon]
MSAEKGQKRRIEVPDNLPWIPPHIIEWDNERKRKRRQQHEELPSEMQHEDPFRTPEIGYDPNNNPFEINNNIVDYGRIDYSR